MDDADRALLLARAKARHPNKDARKRERRRKRKKSRHNFDGQKAAVPDETPTPKSVPVAGRNVGLAALQRGRAPAPAPAPAPVARSIRNLERAGILRRAPVPSALPAPMEVGDSAGPTRAVAPNPAQHGITLPAENSIPDRFWNEAMVALIGWVDDHGSALPDVADRWEGQPVGRWVRVQRQRQSRLGEMQRAALEALPRWCWDEEAARWERGFLALEVWATANARSDPPRHGFGPSTARLGHWVSNQRALYRQGRLDDGRCRRLEMLPKWRWERR